MTMILLFSFMLNSAVSATNEESYSENTKKSHEPKSNRIQAYDDPFRFPMPLGKLDIDKPDERIHQNSRHGDGLASSSGTPTRQSTFKETMISYKNTTKKIISNAIEMPFNTNAKSANVSNVASIDQSVAAAHTNKTTQMYILQTKDKDIPLRYEITGFSNNVLNMTTQPDNARLSIYMSTFSPGTFTIELPRNITDFTNKDRHSPLWIFEDGRYTSFRETENNNYTRKLTMPFNKGTSQIAIAGAHTSPEYGLTTTLYGISMCIAIGVLSLVARQNGFNSRSLNKR